jgi:eight-cysteine-cluster-containing protein
MTRLLVVAILAAGCGRPGARPQVPEASGVAEASAPAPASEPEPIPAPTPASLYAECKDRVEGVGAPGECASDADCQKAGCGAEVCTTVAAAKDVTTTCENKPCFAVLDTCGCHEGQCTWTLKAEIPTPAPGATRLPPTLPPTGSGS